MPCGQDFAAAVAFQELIDEHRESPLRGYALMAKGGIFPGQENFRAAADEFDRFASETDDPALRGDALLVAGELYEQSDAPACALDVYTRYVDEFPRPVETALETRFKIAEIHKAAHDEELYQRELSEIVRIDATVSIVDKNGKIVRHMASGVLGKNAPWPYQQDSLSQKLEWDAEKLEVTNCPEANQYIQREYRAGWTL